ncbi:MAG: lysine--tRNA ligase [Nitrosopumilaceae archaeon]|jgi:lysyl-tRNA synthetase class 1|uniref:Lysine--tRNA ligase n=3 Tax=Candidatus Nitrosomaritimum aestuariumsis TaxID=3342354 RepID=A0AC60W705_9ARCH|nr:lysine--tRNA ligase [Nitrosopumilaceae archaeon]MBA4453448.1 lysine--tRNA ligase [Nitrosopumilaceae archaeon]MBA4459741.1 lysine--tRNA ligase [Nitrosopumilaceae archaeon]MBA4462387.1 lysine--tRNA ligase [Nitrosopumilaceae archaeon]MBA4463112.1 lysine--tRNA ligase [Nitrosopumilaceae archaeon]
MSETETIGKGTWIDKLAHELLEREKSLGRNVDLIKVESGLGASGVPHIGSLGDAVRAYGVKLALENFGYKSELIAYSDDLDGLRKIPEGFPDSLEEHIAKPVSLIPDPFGCHESYGMHMSSILLDGLDKVGIKYEFRRAIDTYKQGLLKDQIHTILQNSTKIGDKISELVGQEKFQKFLPYFPVCANCSKLYTAESTEYLPDERKVIYNCHDAEIGSNMVKGCGHHGEADISKDLGKLAWKVEFAARWAAFDIRFEAYGKDIMDSVKVNDWVSDEILNYPHPHHVKYEMFLDKGGKKISKSLGNVITAQKWLEFGDPKSILLLLYKRITGARELGFEDIPSLMAEYNELEDIYFGKIKLDNQAKITKSKGLYEYVNLLSPPKESSTHVNYRLLIELSKIFKEDRSQRVMKKLLDYGVIKESQPEIEKIIELAGNYADEFDQQEKTEIEIDDLTKKALLELTGALDAEEEPEDIQNTIYQIAKSNDVQPRDFFKTLYQIILGTSRGPKIGPFISDIGRKKVAKTISEYT